MIPVIISSIHFETHTKNLYLNSLLIRYSTFLATLTVVLKIMRLLSRSIFKSLKQEANFKEPHLRLSLSCNEISGRYSFDVLSNCAFDKYKVVSIVAFEFLFCMKRANILNSLLIPCSTLFVNTNQITLKRVVQSHKWMLDNRLLSFYLNWII